MRELFDEIAGQSPLDPQESSRRSARKPQSKRFYQHAGVAETSEGFSVTLDGKPVRTPGKRLVAAPVRALAENMAQEWEAQRDTIDPMSMPLTRLANSIIDGVAEDIPAVSADIAKYVSSDLLFYRASFPEELIARQSEHWDPVLRWATQTLGARFILTEGVMHVTQRENSVAAAVAALPKDAWSVGAMYVVTTIAGSALLALALKHRAIDERQLWAAAHVDEDWNAEKWGADDEVLSRRAARLRDFEAAATVLKAVG